MDIFGCLIPVARWLLVVALMKGKACKACRCQTQSLPHCIAWQQQQEENIACAGVPVRWPTQTLRAMQATSAGAASLQLILAQTLDACPWLVSPHFIRIRHVSAGNIAIFATFVGICCHLWTVLLFRTPVDRALSLRLGHWGACRRKELAN